ncbi:cell wall biosynthesis glycosyltransferase [Megasphaera sp. BL7]|uniref:glycosyltransferase family 2 protein n=1 Tax=unclassified Megasphaera TaxID=2626256 RepID=UPI000357D17D|nr:MULTISPECIES: glycosyltransferase family A protein [unclassified Megasphaera]EPP14211.1 cell wall biosynthesis glycosyltransferase [Megasphaera sp. NM10]EPP15012.1 cell wall biosynthesis glycosyltransferase [Megasphaera sp. BL7]
MSSIELSVIIPAYNAGQTIGRCLDSLLQSVQQAPVEIVCVDDGSKDNTWEILQSYSKKYACLRIFHKENGGVGSARNVGLSQAAGNYIAWVDSDDYVTTDWYATIHGGLEKYNPDCLVFDYFYTRDNVDEPWHIALPEKVGLKAFVYEQSLERELKNFLWNQVIRAALLKKVKFNETYHMLEDYDVLTQVTPKFKKIIHINKCLYHYVQTESSLTHTVSSEVRWNNIDIVQRRYDYYKKIGLPISINDCAIHFCEYLYQSKCHEIKWAERSAIVRENLRLHQGEILRDKGVGKRVKIKAIFAIMGMDSLLRALLKLKNK